MMRFMRQVHRWLGLVIGLQALAWIVSGFGMSLLDAQKVAGEDVAAFDADMRLLEEDDQPLEPHAILARLPNNMTVLAMELRRELGHWIWRIETPRGATAYYARTGEPLKVDESQARRLAEDRYFGEGKVAAVTGIEQPTLEARGHTPPLWRVDFDDDTRTRYYISATDGQLVERRNDSWALFDVLWMLHTMDYVGRDNFNTPWVIVFAFGAVWLSISGAFLVIRSFAKTATQHG